MESIKASDLAKMLNEHIVKHGDGDVFIYDDYAKRYKTFNKSHISMEMDRRFTIDCQDQVN